MISMSLVMNSRVIAPILLVVLSLTLSACRAPSRADKISAKDDTSFETWISSHRDVLTPAEEKELATARQQLRYKVMQAQPGLKSADLSNSVYAQIDGRTVPELLVTSYQLQIERMKTELLNYQPQLKKFQDHDADKSLNDDQKQVVKESLEKLHRLMGEHQEELARLTKRLTELEREVAPEKKSS